MAELRSLELKRSYRRTSVQSLMNDFFVPCLKNAVQYDRIAGYFSASLFSAAAHGFSKFVTKTGAKYRLIVGAKLVEDEKEIIFSDDLEKLIQEQFLSDIIDLEQGPISQFKRHRLQNLSYLLSEGILELRVAVRINEKGRILSHREAEFHEKGGVFTDVQGQKVFFDGSVNESNRGWQKNQEKISVFTSWWGDDNEQRIQTQDSDFEDYWSTQGKNDHLEIAVYDLPSESAEMIIELFPPIKPLDTDVDLVDELLEEALVDDNRWSHQSDAIDWFTSEEINGVGIFEMATGSGKTRTAIGCMRVMLAMETIDRVIITVPNSLLRQWKGELREHIPRQDLKALYEYSSDKRQHLEFKRSKHGSFLIVTHSMLPRLLKLASSWNSSDLNRTLLVVDEMHNVGADRFRADGDEEVVSLDNRESDFLRFGYRLGLSATPWSDHDYENVRNSFLVNSFTRYAESLDNLFVNEDWIDQLRAKESVFYFGLEDGIKKGILAEFDYIPLDYTPTDEEIEKFNKLVRSAFGTDEKGNTNALGAIRAASVFKGSRNKIPVLMKWLAKDRVELTRSLIFVEDTAFGEELMEKLNRAGYTNFSKFFQGDDDWNLNQFANGELDYLVSCHRISEGIDIQTVKQVVLFSSATARLETIQRIGRALRRGKTRKRATIIDFIFDNPNSSTNPDVKRKEWLISLAKERNPT
jgi:superfamily II DNA or RNA helicase